MLNAETKKIINSARDVLVGKIPDPKAQVEQITFAMFYKFMDEKDKEAVALGGKKQFFTDDFENYSWTKLLDPRLSGTERMDLYSQAISKMYQNPHIAQLFRDIYKDAFIPFRSPETLNLFLKEIDLLDYTNTESLGDAFEYLLSIMGSQGDAGQFRTPRHIIDFMVEVVDPKKTDTVLDPACGTAGFLISAYKHILKQHDQKDDPGNKEIPLTPDEKKQLVKNFSGYDISPDMVRLSKVNMFLHGFTNPTIYEYDTLSDDSKWDETFDVILANPPFMTPKGGIKPHKRFSVQANRSEVLFVDYILEHLKPNGRAGIIVPEGIIFHSANAYKALRKKLVEDGLFCVVSLPAGVFNPYSGVKTSILFFDNQLAKKSDSILFVKVENDGYDLGAQRRKIEGEELSMAKLIIQSYQRNIKLGKTPKTKELETLSDKTISIYVHKTKICELGDYYLTGDRYKKINKNKNLKWPQVELGNILNYEQPTNYIVSSEIYDNKYKTPVLTAGKTFILGYTNEKQGIYGRDLPVIIFDDFTTSIKFVDFPFKVKSSAMKILTAKNGVATVKFVYYMMRQISFSVNAHKRFWISEYSKIKIPLPPLEIQEQIVAELDGYQKIIDGAKEVVANWKPSIEFNTSWKKVNAGEVIRLSSGRALTQSNIFKGEYPVYGGNGIIGYHYKYFVKESTLVIGRVGEYCGSVHLVGPKSWVTDNGLYVVKFLKNINLKYLVLILELLNINQYAKTGGQPSVSQKTIYEQKLPLPPLEIQKQIVDKMEAERALVESNKKLIDIYEQKIEEKVKSVWEN